MRGSAATQLGSPRLFKDNASAGHQLLSAASDIELYDSHAISSYRIAKWVDSTVHSAVLEAIRTNRDREHPNAYATLGLNSNSMSIVQDTVAKITRRMTVNGPVELANGHNDELYIASEKGISNIPKDDLNVALHAALRNELLARALGLVSDWSVECDIPIDGDRDWVIQVDEKSLHFDASKTTLQQPLPTVFRRRSHTHPLAYADIKSSGTSNCAFAALNGDDGSARYRASSISAENLLVKQVVLQAQNSLDGPAAKNGPGPGGVFNDPIDTRAPQLLQNDQYGSPEPETTGVVFSAPIEDLITPKDLAFKSPEERHKAMPCLFLEDLWIGYRLDIKKNASSPFNSVHAQTQRISFVGSQEYIEGEMESFIEREQPDDPARGHTSTDLTTYSGLSAGQMKDYLTFLGLPQPAPPLSDGRISIVPVSYGQTQRLLFGHTYPYRLRTVLRGAVSIDPRGLESTDDRSLRIHEQSFPFFRARSLRPGELIRQTGEGQRGKDGETIFLSLNNQSQMVSLVPTPMNVDTSRYHGMLLQNVNEPVLDNNRVHVSDLSKLFKRIPPRSLNYFYDPDVYGVSVHITHLNGDEENEPDQLLYRDGIYCRLVKHNHLKPVTKLYGPKNQWRNRKAILFRFRTTSSAKASIHNDPESQLVTISVPPGAQLRVSLLPLFDRRLLTENASNISTSNQLLGMGNTSPTADLSVIPAIGMQTIDVVHAVPFSRKTPELVCEPNPFAEKGELTVPLGLRKLDSEFGIVLGRIEADAATTKEIYIEGSWHDISDDPRQSRYTLESRKASSAPRSLLFQEYVPVPPNSSAWDQFFKQNGENGASTLSHFKIGEFSYGFVDQFDLQCAENEVFLGQGPSDSQGPANGAERLRTASQNALRLDLKDLRRKLVSVNVVGASRFGDKIPRWTKGSVSRSETTLVDFPSTLMMTSPQISHILPLRKAEVTRRTPRSGTTRVLYGLRIYLKKPFFESGPGERLAIGCLAGEEVAPIDPSDAPHYVTRWGEDPIERAALDVTQRMPKASDFQAVNIGAAKSKRALNPELYPEGVAGGNDKVIYRDNLKLHSSDPKAKLRWVSVASYGVQYDSHQGLWYADVRIRGEFFGACGLALYRHQPSAIPGRELSGACTWAYASIIYGEPTAWAETGSNVHITIGPIFDPNISFELDSAHFYGGVSEDLNSPDRVLRPIKNYTVGKARYYELVVPKTNLDWSLLKKRYGFSFSSASLQSKVRVKSPTGRRK
jgi:hypothetical protein